MTITKQTVALEKIKVDYVPRHKLRPNDWNPNVQSADEFELLCRSLREDGYTTPILALRDGTIIDGEHRWRAFGVVYGEDAEIGVVYVNMTPAQARIATMRHNRARGSEQEDLTNSLMQELDAMGALEHVADSLMLDLPALQARLNALANAPSVWPQLPEPTAWPQSPATYAPSVPAVPSSPPREVDLPPRPQAESYEEPPAPPPAPAPAQTATSAPMNAVPPHMGDLYRLTLLYAGDEAELVRAVLGEKEPGRKVLELCRAEAARVQQDVEGA